MGLKEEMSEIVDGFKKGRASDALTYEEFGKVLKEIEKNHWLVNGRCVKYVDSSFDFRTKTFWRIEIRPFGNSKTFTTANRSDESVDLLEEIMTWLDEGLNKDKK